MTITTKRSLIALLLSLVLVVSLFTIGVSATDTATTAATTEAVETDSVATDVESASKTGSESGSETETETEKAPVVDTSAADAKRTTLIINAIIIAVIILIGVILIVKFRAKLGDFMRSVKSELKKIVWSSKENTRKGFIVVVVIAVIFAIMLGLIDFAFNTGISMFRELLH